MTRIQDRVLATIASLALLLSSLAVAAPVPAGQTSPLGIAIAAVDEDPERARRELARLADEYELVGDVVDYYRALAVSRVDSTAGREAFRAFLAERSSSVLVPDAAVALVALAERAGDAGEVLSLAGRFGRSAPATSEAAAVCLAAGRALAASRPGEAHGYFQSARHKAPLSDAAREAYAQISELRRKHPELAPAGPAALMEEARLLAREGNGAEQVALLERLLSTHAGSAHEAEAELAYGRALGRVRGKSAGADFFEKRAQSAGSASRKAKLLYEAATLRWNDDRNEDARRLFERMLALGTKSADERQALYAVARIHDSAGRAGDAVAAYAKAAAASSGAERAEAMWRRGWVAYRAKDWSTAAERFAAMAAKASPGSEDGGRAEALYWQARSLERNRRRDEATALYRRVMKEFPVGYYAAAAEKRLGGPTAAAAAKAPAPGQVPASSPLGIALRRAALLREAGLFSLAARDLDARVQRLSPGDAAASLSALPKAGAHDIAFRLAADLQRKGKLSAAEARFYLYPKAFADIVDDEARRAGIDPFLVYSLMRQESAFASAAVSPAKALGLMQLLESTANRVASRGGLPPVSAERLFDPATNIRLGVRYLGELSQRFDGNVALVAAAYNAGEDAASRWQPLARDFDEDEMIEQISYRETRGYVKSILRNLRNYRSIYGAARAS